MINDNSSYRQKRCNSLAWFSFSKLPTAKHYNIAGVIIISGYNTGLFWEDIKRGYRSYWSNSKRYERCWQLDRSKKIFLRHEGNEK